MTVDFLSLKETKALDDLIVGLCTAKNEADIIEAMMRHNLAFLDRLHVVDNDSTDGTFAIIKSFGSEFFGCLTWSTDEQTGHMQKDIINDLLPSLHPDRRIAHVVVLDGDEFIRAEPNDFRRQLLASDVPVQLPWVT